MVHISYLYYIVSYCRTITTEACIQAWAIFGGLLFYLSSYRRKIVEDNVQTLKAWATKRALKNPLLEQENRVIAKEIYQSNAGNFFYSFSMMNKPIATVLKHLKIKDAELLKKLMKKTKG